MNSKKIYNITLFSLFVFLNVYFFAVSREHFHGGGVHIISQILIAMINPEFDAQTISSALKGCLQTLTYALASISISFVIAFMISIFSSGVFNVPKFVSAILKMLMSFVRSIHELVWAWLLVIAIGLNPIGAILAISIPYTGALSKVFSELLENQIKNQKASLKIFGASNFQCLIYDYLPRVTQEIFAYTLYRLECAIRSSAALSFVGLGGIGFLIQLSLQDLNFNTMWTYIFFLILLVVIIDYISKNILNRISKNDKRGIYFVVSAWILSWIYILSTQMKDISSLFNPNNHKYVSKFLNSVFDKTAISTLMGSAEFTTGLMSLVKETFLMSLYAIAFTVLLLLPFLIFGSNIFIEIAGSKAEKTVARILKFIANIFFVISRSIPEVLWAMIFVFIFKPGWFPGVIALAIHNFGVLGRLCNDIMDTIDKRSIKALKSNGANNVQTTMYAIFPMIKNYVIIYIFYRWEIIIRTTIVIGFIGAGGLGQALRLAISFFKYEEIGIYILVYMAMVILTEFLSSRVKNKYSKNINLYVD